MDWLATSLYHAAAMLWLMNVSRSVDIATRTATEKGHHAHHMR
jgi:hypothetical protein